MLLFRYFFTEIKTQTSSLILFGARLVLKNDRHARATKTFCLSGAVEKERHIFTYRCQKMEKS